MTTHSEGDPVFTGTPRLQINKARASHARDGALLIVLGIFVSFVLPNLLSVSDDIRRLGIVGAGFILAIFGGIGIGMSAYGWMLTKAKWGSKIFPLSE